MRRGGPGHCRGVMAGEQGRVSGRQPPAQTPGLGKVGTGPAPDGARPVQPGGVRLRRGGRCLSLSGGGAAAADERPQAGRDRQTAYSLRQCAASRRWPNIRSAPSNAAPAKPLPAARLRQGARRMEPDGAVLQLHPDAEHRRPRQVHRLPRQAQAKLAAFYLRLPCFFQECFSSGRNISARISGGLDNICPGGFFF
jgi:hypothetical protein